MTGLSALVLVGGGLIATQWLVSDLIHGPAGLGVLGLGAGVWWLSRPSKPAQFKPPQTLDAWIKRCREVLKQVEAFDGESTTRVQAWTQQLAAVIERDGPQRLALVHGTTDAVIRSEDLSQGLRGSAPVDVSFARRLALAEGSRCWPDALIAHDHLLYVLDAPLMASDLLWLQQLPEDCPAWLLVGHPALHDVEQLQDELLQQLPERWQHRVLPWTGDVDQLRQALAPLRQALNSPQRVMQETGQRRLATLHRQWQQELEQLRRAKFMDLQRRTQWVVAAGVMASPLPSVDLLAMAVANGLMLKEMGSIWGTELKGEVLQSAAGQLARAALAQGVVEWTSQALLGLAKLDAGSWLAAGVMQALSAAYLTRVVGRAMADWLALNAGVAEPDLEVLKQQAPLLIAKAAEQERVDWGSFLQQSRQWVLKTSS
ncbi:MAG: DUF697 domain-containing protein [Synechococcus sp.]